jgi:hypothetical protein
MKHLSEMISVNSRQGGLIPPCLPVGNTMYSDSSSRRKDYLTEMA